MLEFVRAISPLYRVYLLTNLSREAEDFSEKRYLVVKELLQKLVKQNIIKGEQRLMFSQSEVGHIAQIRHLNADLHIESKYTYQTLITSYLANFQITKSLVNFMNKFHLIVPNLS